MLNDLSMETCLFCKVINKEVPSEILYEDKEVVIIKDIHPKAPTHFLILPKKHISSVSYLEVGDKEIGGDLLLAAKKIAEEKEITGYKLVINIGREGGQIINHLHLHFLAGKPISMP